MTRDSNASVIDQIRAAIARADRGFHDEAEAMLVDLIGDVITMTVESASKDGYAKGYTAGYEAGVESGWEQGMAQMQMYGDCRGHG
jgi:flagellar biosynthesis/type III secretory pathway protein FliH